MQPDVANTPLKRRTDERPGLATGDHIEKSFIFLRRPTYPGHQFPLRFLCLGQASLCGADAAHHERLYRHINDRLLSIQVNAPPSAPSSQANLARKILSKNDPVDVREALFALLGKDITTIDGLGPYLSLKLIAECGDDLSSWPSAKHFTSWLGLAPSNKVSGGKMLSSRTRRSGGRAAALLRLAAVTVGRTDTALGAFYRRLSSRIGKAKAVTATARKIAVLFYNGHCQGK